MGIIHTREALHAVAEHVLAPARHRATGRIGLWVTPLGFGTPPFPGPNGADRQILVRGVDLVVRDGDAEQVAPLTTIGDAAARIGIEPGASPEVYDPVTPLQPGAPLALDPSAAAEVAAWFALGNEALQQFRSSINHETSDIQLWPEHFDVALTADRVNFGASPGDADHPEPYLYVGPFDPQDGPFWNEPFGASMPRDRVPDVAAALDFLLEGRDQVR
jgi:hypothetical protein